MNNRGNDKGAQVGGEKIKEIAELRKLFQNLSPPKVDDSILSEKRAENAHDNMKNPSSASSPLDSYRSSPTGNADNDRGRQRIGLEIRPYLLPRLHIGFSNLRRR